MERTQRFYKIEQLLRFPVIVAFAALPRVVGLGRFDSAATLRKSTGKPLRSYALYAVEEPASSRFSA